MIGEPSTVWGSGHVLLTSQGAVWFLRLAFADDDGLPLSSSIHFLLEVGKTISCVFQGLACVCAADVSRLGAVPACLLVQKGKFFGRFVFVPQ